MQIPMSCFFQGGSLPLTLLIESQYLTEQMPQRPGNKHKGHIEHAHTSPTTHTYCMALRITMSWVSENWLDWSADWWGDVAENKSVSRSPEKLYSGST